MARRQKWHCLLLPSPGPSLAWVCTLPNPMCFHKSKLNVGKGVHPLFLWVLFCIPAIWPWHYQHYFQISWRYFQLPFIESGPMSNKGAALHFFLGTAKASFMAVRVRSLHFRVKEGTVTCVCLSHVVPDLTDHLWMQSAGRNPTLENWPSMTLTWNMH